jgi:hypothetical protein
MAADQNHSRRHEGSASLNTESEVSLKEVTISSGQARYPGLEGISFFDKFDSRCIIIDTASKNQPQTRTVHFEPGSGVLYVVETADNPYLMRSGVGINLRTGEYLLPQNRDLSPSTDSRILDALELLPIEYQGWLMNPPGHTERDVLVADILKLPRFSLEHVEGQISRGDHILFYNLNEGLYACKTGAVEPITDIPQMAGGYRVLTFEASPSVRVSQIPEFSSSVCIPRQNSLVGAILPPESEFVFDKSRQGFWKISEEQFKQLMHFAEWPSFDPSLQYPLSREEYVIACALDGIAFDRWGASVAQIHAADPARYDRVSKINLETAIGNFVGRFGEHAFCAATLWVAYQHALRLHIPSQKTEILLVQDNSFGDCHSDILGYKSDISELVKQVVGDAHPTPADIEEDGCGSVGQGVYNASTLFGDSEFLEILRDHYPETFKKIANFIASLPPIEQGPWYGNTTVYPLEAVRDFFPKAYQLILSALPYVPRSENPGIRFQT